MQKFAAFIIPVLILLAIDSFAQSTADVTKKNFDKEQIKLSGIKSKTVWEHRYTVGADALSDSGFKSYYYAYDNEGNIIEYRKYHVSPELSTKEIYAYGKSGRIVRTDRYNSREDRIETIEYKYSSAGKLKRQIHTEYLNQIQPGVYFTIQAYAEEEELFGKIQDELQIEPRLASYTITVNISDNEELNQYIVIGDEADPSSPRYSFSQLSLESQRDLVSYKGPNRKEHTYIRKHLALVEYKYDKAVNLKEKLVYDTSNDLIEKETYYYNADNLKTNYYKYNEDGKTTTKETYSYDGTQNLIESAGLEPDGKITSKLTYKYDGRNLTEKKWINSNGEVNGVYKYVYDDNNRIKEEIKFRGDNEKENTLGYKYDDKGNLLEVIKYDANNKKERLTRNIYEFY